MHALDVPGHGHEVPLALRLVQPAHAHLTPAHDVLDDAEHGLDGLLAQFVQRPACLCAQAVGHVGDRLRSSRRVGVGPKPFGQGHVMRLALHRQQRLDSRLHAGEHVRLAAKTVVGNEGLHVAKRPGQRRNLLERGHHFALVIAGLRDVRGDHHHRLDVHAGLGVVALLEAAAGHRHDARLLVRQVDLVAVLGSGLGRLRVPPARLLPGLALGPALGLFGLELLLLRFESFGGALRNLGLGLRDGAQAVLAARDLGGHIHAIGRAGSIILLRPRQQVLDFLAQLRLDLVGVTPRQRLVLARAGSDLGAVQRNVTELEQLHLARQHQHLHEQRLDLLQKAPPERGQRIVVRMRIGRHKAERHRVVGRALDLAARMHPVGIPVDQQPQQHRRVMRGRAPARVLLDQIVQIEPINHFDHKAREVITGQPLVHRRRQKVGRVSINTNEATHREELLNGLSPLSRIHPSGVSLESPTAS